MKKNYVQKAVLIALAGCAVFFMSCGSKQKEVLTDKQSENVMTLGFTTEMNNFDPFTSMTADARSINFNIFEGLIKVNSDGSFGAGLADSYSVSSDAKSYIFSIRKGVKFHDGKELDADDVLYSVQKAIEKGMAGYSKIETYSLDESGKLVVKLKSADTSFLAYLTSPIVEKDAKGLALNPVGTGPYMMKEYEEQSHLTLVRNKDYWGEGGSLDVIKIKFISGQADMIMNFQAGSIDGFWSNADTVTQVESDSVNVYTRNSNTMQMLALNNAFGPFRDVRVRQAVNYLVDSSEIIETVNYGYGVKTGSPLIPALERYCEDSLAHAYERNVDKAKSLLAEAGYKDGFGFTITVPSVYSVHVKTAEVIVNQLAAAGVRASIRQVDWATWLSNVYKGRNYEATVISLDGAIAYPTAYLARYDSKSEKNFVNFSSPEYDEVYAKAIAATDDAHAVEYFKEAQRILSREAVSVFLEDISTLAIYNKHFEGSRHYPMYVIDLSAIHKVD